MYPQSAQISQSQSVILADITRKYSCKNVLEIGTLHGFSASIFADNVADGGHVTTIERMPKSHATACQNLAHYNNITLICADAAEYLPKMAANSFDLIFIDANKAKYPFYLEESLRLLTAGGIIIADNTNLFGMVLDSDAIIRPKMAKIIAALRKFHHDIAKLDHFKIQHIKLDNHDTMTVLKNLL